jgi:hypothetical protein
MKTPAQRTTEKRRRDAEADLEAALGGLFQRCPALCGFSVQALPGLTKDRAAAQLEDDLFLADVGVYPWQARPDGLLDEIMQALLGLIDERPEARDLLPGRTFTRTLH